MKKNFWKSHHKWEYIKLGIRFCKSPNYIFSLAHGADIKNEKLDKKILKALAEKGIIKRMKKRHK
ncbi:MAG: hypothetical protein IJY78_04750 [Bacteroidaceae bacterium]|nr:hypothetical protein [Bacteroidaceae bacterium]